MSFIEHPTVKRARLAALSVVGVASLLTGLCTPAAQAAPVSTQNGASASSQAEDILAATSAQQQEQGYDRFIINYTEQAKAELHLGDQADGEYSEFVPELYQGIEQDVTSLDDLLGVTTSYVRDTAQNDAVVSLSKPLNVQQAQQYMHKLAENPKVASVEPDLMRQADESTPGQEAVTYNDPLLPRMWAFTDIKAEEALRHSTNARVNVAVIDSGVTKHSDLNENLLPGYDFISTPNTARDGDGRDNNPQDEGDWTTEGQCGPNRKATSSTWHGTHVAGTIGAISNNGIGIAGVAGPNIKIIPVRVLGACGGYDSDIIDGITWASGGHVKGAPQNQNPAQVINMSLGGPGKCSLSYSRAIAAATKRGSIIVTSAGNSNVDASQATPGNCDGVINVGASTSAGLRARYSNYGSKVTLSAPGGDAQNTGKGVLSLINTGKTTPGQEGYTEYEGTSMAAPHVAGIIADMRSLYPKLTYESTKKILTETSRTFTCDRSSCGSGILDGAKAMDEVEKLVAAEREPEPAPTPAEPAPSESAKPTPAPSPTDGSTPAPVETTTPAPTPAPSKPSRPIGPPAPAPSPSLPPYEEQLPLHPIKPKPSPKPTEPAQPAPSNPAKPAPAPVETKKPAPDPAPSEQPAPPSWWYWYDYPGWGYYPAPWHDPWYDYGSWNHWDYGYGHWGGWGRHRGYRGSWNHASWGHPWWSASPGWGNHYHGYGHYNMGYRY